MQAKSLVVSHPVAHAGDALLEFFLEDEVVSNDNHKGRNKDALLKLKR